MTGRLHEVSQPGRARGTYLGTREATDISVNSGYFAGAPQLSSVEEALLKRLPLVILMLGSISVLLAGSARADTTRWLSRAEIKEWMGADVSDQTGPRGRGYWAGRVEELEILEDEDGEILGITGRVKIQITWVTDRTDYECHQIYLMHADNMEDFTHRSLAMRECN